MSRVTVPGVVWFALPLALLHACSGDILVPVYKRDATIRTGDGGCDSTPVVVCERKDVAACFGEAPEDPILSRLPRATGVPLGCSVEFPSPTPLPRTFECYMEARCFCVDKGFGPRWECGR